jgi:outer membrane protein
VKPTSGVFVIRRVLALPCLALIVAAVAAAQTPTKVGVIQAQAALIATKDGQKAVADLETRMGPKKKELDKKRGDIQELQDKLAKGGNAMAEAPKAELMRTIDTKTKSYNRDMEDAQAELETEQRKILDELSAKMTQIIDKYAASNGFAIILDVSSQTTPVLYASTAVDITKDIVDLYDKTSPSAPSTKVTSAPAAPKPAATTPAPAATKPAATPPVKKQP